MPYRSLGDIAETFGLVEFATLSVTGQAEASLVCLN